METGRLLLRGLTDDDFEAVKHIMNSPHVTEVWGHSFGDDDVRGWITRNRQAHIKDGFGYMLACDKQTGEPVGQAGLLHEDFGFGPVVGIGYILAFEKEGRGYASEMARYLAGYAFEKPDIDAVYCDIRPENTGSVAVARRLGMEEIGSFTKIYREIPMKHLIFRLKKQ